jgi:hypothetical protein
MTYPSKPSKVRPNVLAWTLGSLIIVAGILIAAMGVRDLIEVSGRSNMFSRRNAVAQADAVSWVIWGIMILTIGCYVWRAARRRGWKDRLGRVIISVGYLLLAFGMSQAVHSSVKLWSASSEKARDDVALEVGMYFLGFGFVAALLIWVGVKMANEIIITTAYGKVNM